MKLTRIISLVQWHESIKVVSDQNFPVDVQYYSKYCLGSEILYDMHHRENCRGHSLNFAIIVPKSDMYSLLLLLVGFMI
jgi:hypothetical protein